MPLDMDFIREQRPQNQIVYFPSVGSTMTQAARLVNENAPHNTVVIADEQTAGVGRFGRQWHSEADTGIYCSVLLRLSIPPSELPVVTLALGLATAEAIQRSTGIACDLRWPNDVLVGDRKVAGILAQLEDGCIIAGIGINVNQSALPPDLRTPATSLRLASGNRIFAREGIAVALLESLDDFSAMLLQQGSESILRAFSAASSYVMNRRIVYEDGGRVERGVTAGLDESGFLRVRDDRDVVHTIYTGGVRPDLQ
jgi:BirA family transcriptional regulator, biotin operon repressor / biotin---[acetyl-CoA-carboxylase] ligase